MDEPRLADYLQLLTILNCPENSQFDRHRGNLVTVFVRPCSISRRLMAKVRHLLCLLLKVPIIKVRVRFRVWSQNFVNFLDKLDGERSKTCAPNPFCFSEVRLTLSPALRLFASVASTLPPPGDISRYVLALLDVIV
jgi:hypothetical protein